MRKMKRKIQRENPIEPRTKSGERRIEQLKEKR